MGGFGWVGLHVGLACLLDGTGVFNPVVVDAWVWPLLMSVLWRVCIWCLIPVGISGCTEILVLLLVDCGMVVSPAVMIWCLA
jgi:hypothetical protein